MRPERRPVLSPAPGQGRTVRRADPGRTRAYSEPSATTPVDGDVVVWGPAGVAFTMTPDAAEETALRMLEAVRLARADKVD
jgi:hypothetical protein